MPAADAHKSARGAIFMIWPRRSLFLSLFSTLFAIVLSRAIATAQQEKNETLTAVAGVKVGHHTLSERPTGCTVILVEAGAVGGVDVRGAAPGTRETDLLNPVNLVEKVHAIVLAGR